MKTKEYIIYLLMHSILTNTKISFIACCWCLSSLPHPLFLITALTSMLFIVHKINTGIEGLNHIDGANAQNTATENWNSPFAHIYNLSDALQMHQILENTM